MQIHQIIIFNYCNRVLKYFPHRYILNLRRLPDALVQSDIQGCSEVHQYWLTRTQTKDTITLKTLLGAFL